MKITAIHFSIDLLIMHITIDNDIISIVTYHLSLLMGQLFSTDTHFVWLEGIFIDQLTYNSLHYNLQRVFVCLSDSFMNSMKRVIPLHSLYWSIHTKDESKRGSAFAFIFGVNWLRRWGVTASFGMTNFMEFMKCW